MRIQWATDRPLDLWAVAGWTLATALAVATDAPAWLRVPLGLAFVLACPGYAFVAALFPERYVEAPEGKAPDGKAPAGTGRTGSPWALAKARLDPASRRGLQPLERAALALGLSIAIVPLLGLALNYTPWGILDVPVLSTLALFTLGCLGVAWRRRMRLPADERLAFQVQHESPAWSQRSGLDRALTLALVAAVVFAAGSLVYVLAVPRPAEAFTEFYVLGPTGKAACYPATFRDGAYRVAASDADAGCPLQVRNVTVGIVNHEGTQATYHLRVVWTRETRLADNTTRVEEAVEATSMQVELPSVPVDLRLNASFQPQHEVGFTLPPPPFNGTVRLGFQLYREPPPPVSTDPRFLDSPYRRLHLWIDVA